MRGDAAAAEFTRCPRRRGTHVDDARRRVCLAIFAAAAIFAQEACAKHECSSYLLSFIFLYHALLLFYGLSIFHFAAAFIEHAQVYFPYRVTCRRKSDAFDAAVTEMSAHSVCDDAPAMFYLYDAHFIANILFIFPRHYYFMMRMFPALRGAAIC